MKLLKTILKALLVLAAVSVPGWCTSVTGKVFDSSGKAVSGALVRLDGMVNYSGATGTSQADGSFYFYGLDPDLYRLSANVGDSQRSQGILVDARADLAFEEVLWLTALGSAQLALTITDLNGASMGNEWVVLRGPGGVAADIAWDGVLTLGNLQPGQYLLSLKGSSMVLKDRPVTLAAGITTLELKLAPTVSDPASGFQVGMVRGASGQAMAGANVVLSGAFGNLSETTDAYGTYCFSEVPFGAATLRVSASGQTASCPTTAGQDAASLCSLSLVIPDPNQAIAGLSERQGIVPLIYHSFDRNHVYMEAGSASLDLRVDVLDARGRVLTQAWAPGAGKTATLNVAGWGQGVYIAHLMYLEAGKSVSKMVKFIVSR